MAFGYKLIKRLAMKIKKDILFIFISLGCLFHLRAENLTVTSGLALWIDASNPSSIVSSDGVLSHGDRIVQINDIITGDNSFNDYFVQADTQHQPIWFESIASLDGSSGVLFDGVKTFLHSSTLNISEDMTTFIVAQNALQLSTWGSIHRPILASDDNPFQAIGTGYGFAYQMPGVDSFVVSLGNDTTEQKLTAESINTENWELNILAVRRESSTLSEIWQRTSLDTENLLMGNTEVLTRSGSLHTGYNLGAEPSVATRYYKGFICEIIIYNRTLSDLEMQQVSDYLYNKYFYLESEDPFDALLYLPFDQDFNNYGTAIPEKGLAVTYNNITPVLGIADSGIQGRCLDLTEAAMATSAGCVLYGKPGSDNTILENNLNGLKSLTACGWFNTNDDNVTLKSYTGFLGRLGQLMVRSYDDNSRLVLGVNNNWTTADNNVKYDESNQWVFWAVTYDGTIGTGNVKWYKGLEGETLSLLATHSLNAGTLATVDDELVVANLLTNGSYSFAGLFDELRLFGSKTNNSGALPISVIQEIFDYSQQTKCGDNDHFYPTADINHDCRVDLHDLAELAYNWQIDVN